MTDTAEVLDELMAWYDHQQPAAQKWQRLMVRKQLNDCLEAVDKLGYELRRRAERA